MVYRVNAGVVVKTADGNVLTSYYNADATDKAVMVHNINSDILADLISVNRDEFREMLEEEE